MATTRHLAAILAADVGGYLRLMGGGRRRHARTPQSAATCRSRTMSAQEPAAPAGGPNGLDEGAENDRDQRHPD